MFYVYLLQSQKVKRTYIGYTDNLKNRLEKHNNKRVQSTKNDTPWKLVYYESFFSKKDARDRENKLKYHGQAKRRLIERLQHSMES